MKESDAENICICTPLYYCIYGAITKGFFHFLAQSTYDFFRGRKNTMVTATKIFSAKKITVTAIMAALSTVLMFISFPLPTLIPAFIKMDFSELPALITSFVISPVAGVVVCLVKNLINVLFTTTVGVGELANFVLGAVMVFPAGMIYKYRKSRVTALIGCAVGSVVMAVCSIFINYYVTYPFYTAFMPMEAIIGMYQAINPNVENLWDALIWFNMPFTFCKGAAVSAITFLVYKPLSKALKTL